jgi:hypothetical protein
MVTCIEFVSNRLWCVFQVLQQYCLYELASTAGSCRRTCTRQEAGHTDNGVAVTQFWALVNTLLPAPSTFPAYVEYRLFARTIKSVSVFYCHQIHKDKLWGLFNFVWNLIFSHKRILKFHLSSSGIPKYTISHPEEGGLYVDSLASTQIQE